MEVHQTLFLLGGGVWGQEDAWDTAIEQTFTFQNRERECK
jgi:hypothetical protein